MKLSLMTAPDSFVEWCGSTSHSENLAEQVNAILFVGRGPDVADLDATVLTKADRGDGADVPIATDDLMSSVGSVEDALLTLLLDAGDENFPVIVTFHIYDAAGDNVYTDGVISALNNPGAIVVSTSGGAPKLDLTGLGEFCPESVTGVSIASSACARRHDFGSPSLLHPISPTDTDEAAEGAFLHAVAGNQNPFAAQRAQTLADHRVHPSSTAAAGTAPSMLVDQPGVQVDGAPGLRRLLPFFQRRGGCSLLRRHRG